MRKLYNIIIAIVAIVSLASCTGEVDDIFDRSSAARMTEAIATDRQMLVDAPNGWLMQYFCENTYGGYNVFVKFNDDNTATVANEVFELGSRETSHYKLEQSMGVVLSFDEYNELFHFFSAPANPNGIGDDGIGMRGDFEFRVISATADRFELEGKKHGARIVMTRLADGVDWDDYITRVRQTEQTLQTRSYDLVNSQQQDTLRLTSNYRAFTYHDAQTDQDVVVPYIVTPGVVHLSQPITVSGVAVDSLSLSSGGEWTAQGGISLQPVVPALVDQLLDTGTYWSFVQGRMSQLAAQYFQRAEQASAGEGEDVMFMALGVNPNAPNLGWSFFFRSGNYIGTITLQATRIDDTHISLLPTGYDNNGQYYFQAGYNYVANGILRGTFELSADNPANPTYIRLTHTDSNLQGEYVDVYPELQYYIQN